MVRQDEDEDWGAESSCGHVASMGQTAEVTGPAPRPHGAATTHDTPHTHTHTGYGPTHTIMRARIRTLRYTHTHFSDSTVATLAPLAPQYGAARRFCLPAMYQQISVWDSETGPRYRRYRKHPVRCCNKATHSQRPTWSRLKAVNTLNFPCACSASHSWPYR